MIPLKHIKKTVSKIEPSKIPSEQIISAQAASETKNIQDGAQSVENVDAKIILAQHEGPVTDADVDSGSAVNDKKRTFMKVAGTVGVGMIAASLFPKKAEALVFGSTPTANIVGIKNTSNVPIDPATQETLAGVKAQTDLLTFDSGSNPANLKVNISAVAPGTAIELANTSGTPINPATEDSLAVVKGQLNKLTFDGSNNLLTSGGGGGAASVVGLKDNTGAEINPSTEDSIVYLRRMVKLMESQAVVDNANRQRITIDSLGPTTAVTTTLPVSGTVTATVAAATVTTVASVTNMVTLAGQNQQMFQDTARIAYANGIRQNLSFT